MQNIVKDKWITIFFISATGFVLLFNLWGRSLENHGYIRYAEVAREMIRSGDWIVPHLNGKIFIDKPPLLFWLIAIPSYIYGSVTPFIAKLPSALLAWVGVIIIFLWGKKVYGRIEAGIIAGGSLLSSYQYFFQARLAKTDIILCVFVILSLYFFYLWYNEQNFRKFPFCILSLFFIGLGILTKGPFGFFPLIFILIYIILNKQWSTLIGKEFILGYIILGLTVLPWAISFIFRIGLEQTILLIKENKILSRTAPFYFYFIQIWGEFFPGSIFIPFLTVYIWKEKKRVWQSKYIFFLIWFLTLFISLTFFRYKASRYLLPTLPPLGLMIGGIWKKGFKFLIIIFLFAISVWHIREFIWIKKDNLYSPGMTFIMELRPFLKGEIPFAYKLDISTLEEINFYLDPPIPIIVLKDLNHLRKIKEYKKIFIIMPKESYEDLKIRLNNSISFLKEFPYKKGRLILTSY
ncbi:MAG: ArnT family glycosyltransferase [Candidatus Jordarchaeum sp.]|uniref:ArnT family glycosyltransferase n=1 Tax=Candidatus Jordarchaeum sp. TaxID=2823881 RepID=UPI00404AC602